MCIRDRIKTDSLEPGEKKPKNSILYKYFKCFGNEKDLIKINDYFDEGMGWGDLKKELFKIINDELGPFRDKYLNLMNNPKEVEEILRAGEIKAQKIASANLKKIRSLVGIRSL